MKGKLSSERKICALFVCIKAKGFKINENQSRTFEKNSDKFDWSCHNSERAFGLSVSLYEKNPNTGVNAGEPIADVWGVVGRNNNGVSFS